MTDPASVLLDREQLERGTRDVDDLRLLAEIIGVNSSATAVQICAEFFPEDDIPPRSAAVLQELFG